MKVFGGPYYVSRRPDLRQYQRGIVATTSQKKAAQIAGVSLNEVRNYWCVTANKAEIEAATAKPGVLLIQTGIGSFEEHTP